MTTTPTTDLQGLLAARKAELNGESPSSPPEVIDAGIVDPSTGEIVPVAAVEQVPPSAPAAPAPVEIQYPQIPPKVVGGLPYVRDYMKLAKTICQTEFVPAAYRGRPDAICAAYMAGYEHGMGPMQSLDSFNVIEGKVGLSAEAMRALIMQAGHLFILSEEVGAAIVTCRRKDWPADVPNATYRYDLEDANTAQLLRPSRSGKPTGWQKNPRAMLSARATSGAGRAYFADVLAGMSYTPEEIRDFTDEQEVTPSPPTPASVPEATAAPIAPAPEASSGSVPDPAPPADSTGGAVAISSQDAENSAPATESTPPKRPRGRPRKAVSATSTPAAPPAEPPSPTTAPSAPTPPEDGPPELTSLNSPGENGVLAEMRKGLTAIMASLPVVQQSLCRAFLAQHFPQGSMELDASQLQKCIDIAAGWPESADQHPIPGAGDQLEF